MLKILQSFMKLFGKHKDKAADLMEEHGDKLDTITDKIPGEADDKLVDQARDMLKKDK